MINIASLFVEGEIKGAGPPARQTTTSSLHFQERSKHADGRAGPVAIRNATGIESPVQRQVVDIWGKAAIGEIKNKVKLDATVVCKNLA